MSGATSESLPARERLLGWYRVFCLVFGIFIILFAGVRVGLLRAGHRDDADRDFLSLRSGSRAAMAAFDAHDDQFFSKTLGELARGSENLQLLAVQDKGLKVYYFYARSAEVFSSPPEPTADMRVVPPYRAPPLATARIESTFDHAGTGRVITVEALYRILTPADLHRVGREVVYILLIFLIVTGTVLVVSVSLAPRGAVPAAGRRAPAPQAAGPAVEPRSAPRATGAGAAWAPSPSAQPATAEPVDLPEPLAPAPSAPAPQHSAEPARSQGLPTRKASMYREDTGLVYGDYLEARLKSEIDRAAASDQDMVLAVLSVDSTGAQSQPEGVEAAIAERLRSTFPYRDLLFSYNTGFAVIMPDTNLDKALARLEDFRTAVAATPVGGQGITVSVGIAARNGRIIGEATLLREASHSLAKAIRDGRNQVVAFRADPDKFRRVLAT